MSWYVILCLPIILVQQDLKLLKNVEALATLGIYAQNEAENIVITVGKLHNINIQKISSIHKFILKMQQISGSHDLRSPGHAYPKIIESTFSFPQFVPACKRSVYSICSFLRHNQFESPMIRLTTPIFDQPTQKRFDQLLIFVNLYQHAINQFFHLFRYSQFQCPVNRLATPIFDHNFQSPFNLHEFVPACKKSVDSICSFLSNSQIQSPVTRLPTSIFDHAQSKTFQQTFNFCKFLSTCTNEAISLICSTEIVDLKIL